MNNLSTPLLSVFILSLAIAAFFSFFFFRAVATVVKEKLYERKLKKQSKRVANQQQELKQKGLKPFKFNNGKTTIFAKDFRQANAKFQEYLKAHPRR